MTAQVVHCKVSLPDGTTFEDTSSFSFTYLATGSSGTVPTADLTTLVDNFLNGLASGQTQSMAHYLSHSLNRSVGAVTLEATDVTAHLDGSPAGTPFFVDAHTLASGVATSLPAQLAAVCGFRAAYGADLERGVSGLIPTPEGAQDDGAPATHTGISRPRASDRGRFYLGPFSDAVIDETQVGGPIGTVPFDDLLQAVNGLVHTQNPGTANEFKGVVWSRVKAAVKPIAFIFIDEALGVVRRRADTTLNRVHNWVATT